MAEALTAPFLLLAALLGLAGIAKLRSPAPAVGALIALGAPNRPVALRRLVRLAAVIELGLGMAAWARPWPALAAALAVLLVGFAGLTLALARRRTACGCFGSADAPASVWQSLLSLLLAGVATLAVVWAPHGIGWLVARWPAAGTVAVAGLAAAAYGLGLAYSELPRAWTAWRNG